MHGSASLALVIGIMPIVLGLGAITASLAPSVVALGVLAQDRPFIVTATGRVLEQDLAIFATIVLSYRQGLSIWLKRVPQRLLCRSA